MKARGDHRLVQLLEKQAAIELRSLISSLLGLHQASCLPHQDSLYLQMRTCMRVRDYFSKASQASVMVTGLGQAARRSFAFDLRSRKT